MKTITNQQIVNRQRLSSALRSGPYTQCTNAMKEISDGVARYCEWYDPSGWTVGPLGMAHLGHLYTQGPEVFWSYGGISLGSCMPGLLDGNDQYGLTFDERVSIEIHGTMLMRHGSDQYGLTFDELADLIDISIIERTRGVA